MNLQNAFLKNDIGIMQLKKSSSIDNADTEIM